MEGGEEPGAEARLRGDERAAALKDMLPHTLLRGIRVDLDHLHRSDGSKSWCVR